MGNLSIKNSELQKAQNVKYELYARVNAFKDRRRQQYALISPQKKNTIVTSTATQLAQYMQQGRFTSYQITLCFCQRAATVGLQLNCVFDQMFEEALEQAKKCDKLRAEMKAMGRLVWTLQNKNDLNPEKELIPPFLGVPISVKESILLKGRASHIGYNQPKTAIPQQDFLYIQLIKQMGFIPFVRSNVPQANKTFCTNNNMFGYAKNPWNITRSTGGSSGGEGGLAASCCSPIGIGSDIGGSIRSPSQWCGLVTLFAPNRTTKMGNAITGRYSAGMPVKGSIGIISKSVQDQINTFAYLCEQKNHLKIQRKYRDAYLYFKSLNCQIFTKCDKRRIGIVKHLKTLRSSKAHQRAVQTCKNILQQKGHTVIQTELPDFQGFYFFLMKIILANGNGEILDQVQGKEPMIAQYKLLKISQSIPWLLKKILIWFIRKKLPRLAQVLHNSKPLSIKELYHQIYQVQTVLSQKTYNVFANDDLSCIIMPGWPISAPKLGTISKLQYCNAYLAPCNVLGYPAGILPVTKVQQDELFYQDQYKDMYTKAMNENMKGAIGLPVGVQIISTPYHQQEILYIMKQLESEIQFRKKNPYPK